MERIKRLIRQLGEQQWAEAIPVGGWSIRPSRYVLPGEYKPLPGLRAASAEPGESLLPDPFPGEHGVTYFLQATAVIPRSWEGHKAGLLFEAGGEGLLRINGKSAHGVDRNHAFVLLDPAKIGWEPYLEIELYDPIPEPVDPLNRQAEQQPPIRSVQARLVRVNEPLQSLYYSVQVASNALSLLPEGDLRHKQLHAALYAAMDALNGGLPDRANDVAWLQEVEAGIAAAAGQIGNASGLIHMVGQSHIDVAWLWPVRETVRKVSRTFSTMDALMEEYPHFQYAQSQPQLYAYLKANDPELYGRIKQRIAEGRWELVGGMWVEPDLNIPSGESLIRQMLYGQRFYEQEFGKRSNIEWLPDTFGYCASLPQILKHGGIEYFMTSKLNWNDTNQFPYDLFQWTGIDGTSILSYLNHGLNEHTLPKDVAEHWASYRQKGSHSEQMLLYGHGDGGGGVTREMLEYIDRSALMAGQPASRISNAAEFFDGIAEAGAQLPEWRGDLYLELHRGTYTTHARNKRFNRKAEALYRDAEIWGVLGGAGDQPSLGEGWRLILLNQFHDIIPGTAIPEAYTTSTAEYGTVFAIGHEAKRHALASLAGRIGASAMVEGGDDTAGAENVGNTANTENTEATGATKVEKVGKPYLVFNSLGWSRSSVVVVAGGEELLQAVPYGVDGEPLPHGHQVIKGHGDSNAEVQLSVQVSDVPAFGYQTFWLRNGSGTTGTEVTGTGTGAGTQRSAEQAELGNSWETSRYVVGFNERGEISRLYDKANDRELLLPGRSANQFGFYHDRPIHWDAWDIDSRFEEQVAGQAELVSKRVIHQSAASDILGFVWKLGNSQIEQRIHFYHCSPRMDFETKVEWQEQHKLLKVVFPLDIVTEKATYEIPFGALERPTHRNTSWQQAQYEVCGHRFADLSEAGYGVSLLNDCKYGYDVHGSTIRLSLLRAPRWPDEGADLGEHSFTYSLYPHEGDWKAAHTVRQAIELNQPLSLVDPKLVASKIAGTGNQSSSKPSVPSNAMSGTAAASPGQLGELVQSGQPEQWPTELGLIGLQSNHVILDTVKQAEDGSAIVLRFYESAGGREHIELQWPGRLAGAVLADALEHELPDEEHAGLVLDGERIRLSFRPFEIKTVLLRTK